MNRLLHALVCLFGVSAGLAGAAEADMPAGVIELDETVISGNEELPKVLYIVPWQQPEGLPDIDLPARGVETELFRRLYPPAYRRELGYLEAARRGVSGAGGQSAQDSKE